MDNELRARLLAMPAEYRRETEHIIDSSRVLASVRHGVEVIKVSTTTALAKAWAAETRTNEQTRNAQLAESLLFNDSYQAKVSQCQVLEQEIKGAQLRIECLRFEAMALIAVVPHQDVISFEGVETILTSSHRGAT